MLMSPEHTIRTQSEFMWPSESLTLTSNWLTATLRGREQAVSIKKITKL